MFCGTITGAVILTNILGAPQTLELERVVGVALIATIAEAISGMFDNFAIVASVIFFVRATAVEMA
jgi:hypothetical protein